MNTADTNLKILQELTQILGLVKTEETDVLLNAVSRAEKIFVAGSGRSLLMIRSFAMRLMQMGYSSYVVGETVTPAITADDLLIIASGSGETGTLTSICRKAKKIGASVALITIYPDSSIGRLANMVIQIPAFTTKTGQISGSISVQPGASTFEQCVLLLCDSLTLYLGQDKSVEENNRLIMKFHANLE